jgi:PAS domain S-box-containing protein
MSKLARDQYRILFECSPDAMLIIDNNTFIDCNDATVEMLQYKSCEQLLSTHPSELSPVKQADGRDSFEKAEEMISIALHKGNHRFEWLHRRATGDDFPVEVLLTAISYDNRTLLHVVWRDITQRIKAEAATVKKSR